MMTFKLDVPRDFGDQIRNEFEKKLADNLRREGIYGVTVRINQSGQAVFSGSEDALKKVEAALPKWK